MLWRPNIRHSTPFFNPGDFDGFRKLKEWIILLIRAKFVFPCKELA
jgi:hypothetical protein